jgi:hypothetical protein
MKILINKLVIRYLLLFLIFFSSIIASMLFGMQSALHPGKFFYSVQSFKRLIIPSKAVPLKEPEGVTRFIANDFFIELEEVNPRIPSKENAGLIVNAADEIKSYEQDGLALWSQHNLDLIFQESVYGTFENKGFDGGLRKVFEFQENLFAFTNMYSSSKKCYFSSIVNLTQNFEVFRSQCIKGDNIDFNNSSGGNATLGDSLLFALGAPSVNNKDIANLAQDMKSAYGKILLFSKERLTNKNNTNKYDYEIYSSGHRNIQGMVNVKNNIYAVEHGPKGGDEINLILKDRDYGFPSYSLGSTYSYGKVEFQGTPYDAIGNIQLYEPPLYSFIPSVATSNIAKCPEKLSYRYKPLTCLMVSGLRGSISFILIEPVKQKVISVETVIVGKRVREFSKGSSNKTYISADYDGTYEMRLTNVADK